MTFYKELEKLAERYPPLKKEAMERLARRAAEGDEVAIDLLFKHNAKRILYFVQEYYDKGKMYWMGKRDERGIPNPFRPAITRDEVTRAAADGVWKAIQTYDPDRGPFNSHANVCIWQEIYRLFQFEQRQQQRLAKLGEIEEERCRREYRDPEAEALAEEFFDFAASALTQTEYEALLVVLGRAEGKPPDDLEGFLAGISEKLRAKAPRGKWEAWARALLGD